MCWPVKRFTPLTYMVTQLGSVWGGAVSYDAQTAWLGLVGRLLRSMRPSASLRVPVHVPVFGLLSKPSA